MIISVVLISKYSRKKVVSMMPQRFLSPKTDLWRWTASRPDPMVCTSQGLCWSTPAVSAGSWYQSLPSGECAEREVGMDSQERVSRSLQGLWLKEVAPCHLWLLMGQFNKNLERYYFWFLVYFWKYVQVFSVWKIQWRGPQSSTLGISCNWPDWQKIWGAF